MCTHLWYIVHDSIYNWRLNAFFDILVLERGNQPYTSDKSGFVPNPASRFYLSQVIYLVSRIHNLTIRARSTQFIKCVIRYDPKMNARDKSVGFYANYAPEKDMRNEKVPDPTNSN